MTQHDFRRPDRHPRPIAIGGGALFLFVLLAFACAGAVAYLVLVQNLSWTAPPVLGALAGALWFAGRALFRLMSRRED